MSQKSWQEELLEARGIAVPKKPGRQSKAGLSLPAKTVCPVCTKPIKPGQSYCCPAPDFTYRHFYCYFERTDDGRDRSPTP